MLAFLERIHILAEALERAAQLREIARGREHHHAVGAHVHELARAPIDALAEALGLT